MALSVVIIPFTITPSFCECKIYTDAMLMAVGEYENPVVWYYILVQPIKSDASGMQRPGRNI